MTPQEAAQIALRYTKYATADRYEKLFELGQLVVCEGVPGVFVECGVAGGGSAVALALSQSERALWLFDTFTGLPAPTREDGPDAPQYTGVAAHHEGDVVQALVEALGVVMQDFPRIHTRKGLFEHTLPAAIANGAFTQIALLHIDADWYESTKCVLDNLGPLLSPGAAVIVDDYGHWQGCRTAVDDWLDMRCLHRWSGFQRNGYTQVWWRMP